jgi:hypothetical protein
MPDIGHRANDNGKQDTSDAKREIYIHRAMIRPQPDGQPSQPASSAGVNGS